MRQGFQQLTVKLRYKYTIQVVLLNYTDYRTTTTKNLEETYHQFTYTLYIQKNTIRVQQIVYEALCNCAMGYFTSIFVGVEMAQMVKAQF